ncbi:MULTISPECIES: DoxX family protein [Streptomyces]|uniref:DoxX family protein n=1 Tax=Streptomyces solicathayae TaxID=3081768 RepID=A0ABZ0LXG8_9ACTN|nr:DoxX family protein [Streptomyces sp. HUAS YS2]WOX23503.1 DoxX family protein [Streptomyces sp. HUAS YS2]
MNVDFTASTATTIVTVVAAALVGFSAFSVFTKAQWVVQPMADYGIPMNWLPLLGTAKAAGSLGLLAGLFVPVLGLAAAVCLVLYFTGAVIAVVRARSYAHIPFPLVYVAPVVAALILAN